MSTLSKISQRRKRLSMARRLAQPLRRRFIAISIAKYGKVLDPTSKAYWDVLGRVPAKYIEFGEVFYPTIVITSEGIQP
ncbi:MAG TPA: hypothetical protein VGN15_14000 [Ktedonobacteraceae bacterium]|jgi:hypothetical protein|nr:hypothetical protein [Ktedonobacteraceae bacterium]